MARFDEAVVEARRSAEIWIKVATVHPHFESIQIAKTFRTLMQCEIANNHNDDAIENLRQALGLLQKPLEINPKPLAAVLSEMIDLAMDIDADAVARVVPSELLALLGSVDRPGVSGSIASGAEALPNLINPFWDAALLGELGIDYVMEACRRIFARQVRNG